MQINKTQLICYEIISNILEKSFNIHLKNDYYTINK